MTIIMYGTCKLHFLNLIFLFHSGLHSFNMLLFTGCLTIMEPVRLQWWAYQYVTVTIFWNVTCHMHLLYSKIVTLSKRVTCHILAKYLSSNFPAKIFFTLNLGKLCQLTKNKTGRTLSQTSETNRAKIKFYCIGRSKFNLCCMDRAKFYCKGRP